MRTRPTPRLELKLVVEEETAGAGTVVWITLKTKASGVTIGSLCFDAKKEQEQLAGARQLFRVLAAAPAMYGGILELDELGTPTPAILSGFRSIIREIRG